MRKIAVVGGGYAGLAASWHLLQKGFDITLFDLEDGKSASVISTGLLQIYPGEHARRSWEGEKALQETISLLDIASNELGEPVYLRNGLFRPAVMAEQEASFRKTASLYSDVFWWDEEEVKKKLPYLSPFPGLFVPGAITVDSAKYVEGLHAACLKAGMQFQRKKVESQSELSSFDSIIIAAGAATLDLTSTTLPLSITKGQMLVCKLPEGFDLTMSIGGKGHISSLGNGLCFIGSTYERDYKSLAPDLERALLLKDLVSTFLPVASDFEVVECRAALRIAQKASYLPLIEQLDEKTWIYTGLGSRGLLYHGLFAKKLL
jgi:glycine/D-amino acid oxidase-like deaminating enzyme